MKLVNAEHPLHDKCYVLSEALYHMLGGKASGWCPMQVTVFSDDMRDSVSHWYLRHSSGAILDVTAGQFEVPIPYPEGRGRGFLTSAPSYETQDLAWLLLPQGRREGPRK